MDNGFHKLASTSERLKIAMKETGKKQADLVRATGIDKGSISHYVSGRYEPKSDAIYKLAIALNVSEMWLWGFDAPKERPQEQNQEIEEDISNYGDLFELADIIARLRSDAEFRSLVETLCKLDSVRLNGVIEMLNAFAK